jgi:adenylate cyclase
MLDRPTTQVKEAFMGFVRFSFTSRLIALITILCVSATLIVSSLLIWLNYRMTLAEATNQGQSVARLLAKSARLSRMLPSEVEELFAQHMVVSARLLAEFVDVAEKAGLPSQEIISRLDRITEETVLDEFWVTDENGHAYLHRINNPDFTFSPSPEQQPQAHEFWKLLKGEKNPVIQKARKREIDNEHFKYVGVSGVDKPRIVQVGYNANYIKSIEERLGIQRAVDNLLDSDEIDAIFIFNKDLSVIASPKTVTRRNAPDGLTQEEVAPVKAVIESGEAKLVTTRNTLSFISPIQADEDSPIGAALIRTSTMHINDLINFQLKVGSLIALLTAFVGAALASLLARRQAAPILAITDAARKVEAREFSGEDLRLIEDRGDEVGQLARVFRKVSLDFLDREKTLDSLVRERTAELSERNLQLETLSTRLSKYLSPQIYRSLFDNDRQSVNSTKRKKLTVFFSDIVNFSEITERLEAEDITLILNEYLNEMANIALKYGATIDKYVGDAIMIFFGDPETLGVNEDARACVAMAIEMQKTLSALAERWRRRGFDHPFDIRIGINTGYCTVGDFGSDERIDYTIIGHQVNLAARLEQAASPGAILIAHETYLLVKDFVEVQAHEPLFVKGNSRALQAYRVLGLRNAVEPALVREEKAGLSLALDLAIVDREEAIRILSETLRKISQRD